MKDYKAIFTEHLSSKGMRMTREREDLLAAAITLTDFTPIELKEKAESMFKKIYSIRGIMYFIREIREAGIGGKMRMSLTA